MKRGSEVAVGETALAAWAVPAAPPEPAKVASETTTDATLKTVGHLIAVPPHWRSPVSCEARLHHGCHTPMSGTCRPIRRGSFWVGGRDRVRRSTTAS